MSDDARDRTDRLLHGEDGITRRRFITGVGVAGVAAVAAGYGLTVWTNSDSGTSPTVHRPAPPKLGGRDDRTLVVVELGGGNDGLNTVVPTNDPTYFSLRPTLAVHDPIPIDDTIGLAPQLPNLARRYLAGTVAIVEGVGYADPNLSHFASLAYWWTGTPGAGAGTGWLGRYLDGTVGLSDPLAGIGIGPVPSPALSGDHSFATSIANVSGLQPVPPSWLGAPDRLVRSWSRFAPATPDPSTLTGRVERAVGLTIDARDRLGDALGVPGADGGETADELQAGTLNGRGASNSAAVLQYFELAARLIASNQQPRVVYISGLGDYDNHQGLAEYHPGLLTTLDDGIETFFTTLDAAGATDRAVLMTVSEFGRRPSENGSGTDHGTAAPHFVVGAPVSGGRYGAPPSLTKLDRSGNLVFTTDFRSLYATAVQGWLDVDAGPVVGPGFEPLPLFA